MILVDDRTGSKELYPYLPKPKILCQLEFADFAYSGNGPNGQVSIGVERKAIKDFLSSMTSGRLSGHQLIGLKKQYDYIYIILEGIWKPDPKDGRLLTLSGKKWSPISQGSRRYMAREVWNFAQSLSVMANVMIVHTGSMRGTAQWLGANFAWWQKKWKAHKSHLQFHDPPVCASLVKPNLVTKIASQLDGVGWDKARKIGKRFSNLREMMDAGREDWTAIEGIGKKTTEKIMCQLSKEWE